MLSSCIHTVKGTPLPLRWQRGPVPNQQPPKRITDNERGIVMVGATRPYAEQYGLYDLVEPDGFVYAKINKAWYGLKQSGPTSHLLDKPLQNPNTPNHRNHTMGRRNTGLPTTAAGPNMQPLVGQIHYAVERSSPYRESLVNSYFMLEPLALQCSMLPMAWSEKQGTPTT